MNIPCKTCKCVNTKVKVCINCPMDKKFIQFDDFLQRFILVIKEI